MSVFMEKWVPPIIAGLLAGGVTIMSKLWLEPDKEKRLAVFDDKRAVSRDLQDHFSKFLISFDVYRQHMLGMNEINQSNYNDVEEFKANFRRHFGEYQQQTLNLSYGLAHAQIYFSDTVKNEINSFRKWHNEVDEIMQKQDVTKWPNTEDYQEWRITIITVIAQEIKED